MPWNDVTIMDLRRDFVTAATQQTMPFTALCARFGISRKTGYKWLARFAASGAAGLADQSRRPHASPGLTEAAVTERIRIVATVHPTWGGRLIRHALLNQGLTEVPAASTITAILAREGLRSRADPAPHPVIRFEADAPNHRWQMDFKGWTATRTGRLLPFTVLDEYSRFLLVLEHVPDGTFATVQTVLTECFRRFGVPLAVAGRQWAPLGQLPSRDPDPDGRLVAAPGRAPAAWPPPPSPNPGQDRTLPPDVGERSVAAALRLARAGPGGPRCLSPRLQP